MGSSAAYPACRSRCLAWPLALVPMLAAAEALPTDPLERQCWLAHTGQRAAVDLREPVSVHFSNLKSGYRVRTPFWVEFGVRGMGVIPAGNEHAKSGHHHILIDTPLPAHHWEQIPFNDKHRHFGKAQTGTALDLPPGKHTLRLLFADHAHRPYFVYSNEITITVAGKRASDPAPVIDANRFEATCQAWFEDEISAPRTAPKEVYLKGLRDGDQVASPFTVSFGVTGLGVAPADKKVKDTGHFVLNVVRPGAPPARSVLSDGRTETVLDLPRGDYTLETTFEDADGATLLKAAPLRITVTKRSL